MKSKTGIWKRLFRLTGAVHDQPFSHAAESSHMEENAMANLRLAPAGFKEML